MIHQYKLNGFNIVLDTYSGSVHCVDDDHDKTFLFDEYGNPYIHLEEGQIFYAGDNRLNSTDSRIFGAVMRDEIVGKTNLTVFPFSRFGTKK